MSSTFGADFDQLRKDAFGPFVEHMTQVKQRFEYESAQHLPVLDHTRGDLDEAVQAAVDPNRDQATYLLKGLTEVTTGDTSRVFDMSQRIAAVEGAAAESATFATGSGTVIH
ncbi:hypothetical protein BJ973_003893 [Actinoplanes tereljensis]|uniref:Uncharacterized protein n=1 Tax=Paractinoplanes tereljensis TaxID=571912 RepID=A0A919NUW2_9ACTN|nr:hypothetical protein [Actinoplanes tereljensis]GIF25615.1 hypothetical protein Ate02nite_83450 [Actinoplanes tereljensis]